MLMELILFLNFPHENAVQYIGCTFVKVAMQEISISFPENNWSKDHEVQKTREMNKYYIEI